jgi:hypothetical protein
MAKTIPPELEDKFKACKEKVIAGGQDEDAAYGICYTSIVEGKSLQDATKSWLEIKLFQEKIGAMISGANKKKLQAVHDMCVDMGAECSMAEEKHTHIEIEEEKSFAVPKDKELNLSYVKSLGIDTSKSMAVKFTAKDEIKGYTFMWGTPEKTDVEIEYFTSKSNFWDDTLGKSLRPLTWDHAQDADFKASPVIGNITDFGDDELGRWYVAKLDTSHKYRKVIDQLIKDGVLGTSSDSAPQYVVREKTGKSIWIKEWPWFASALTNTPAEPRMIGSLEFLKSLGVILPDANASNSRYEYKKRQAEFLKLNQNQIKR